MKSINILIATACIGFVLYDSQHSIDDIMKKLTATPPTVEVTVATSGWGAAEVWVENKTSKPVHVPALLCTNQVSTDNVQPSKEPVNLWLEPKQKELVALSRRDLVSSKTLKCKAQTVG